MIYVTMDGVTFSLTPDAWRKLVEAKVNNTDYDLDQLGRLLKRSEWKEQCHMYRWCDEDWADELERLSS